MSKILKLNFPDFELAWEGMNELLANNEEEIKSGGYGDIYGTEMTLYNAFIYVEKATLRDDFDFGKILGYKYKKWSKLVSNYVDLNYLDLVKSEVLSREKKLSTNTSYNYTFHFDNSHGSGKDCLISLTFQRRIGESTPIIIFTTRASEATKRLVFDFLLLQRITEYVYGKGVKVKALLYIPFMYINVESFLIYAGYKGLDKVVIPHGGKYTPFQERILKRFEEFTHKPLSEIKYKVHRRAAAQIQKDKSGEPLSKSPSLLAKDLVLEKPIKVGLKTLENLNKGITIK